MKIAILDIETTGFLNRGGKIVEVGIVELDLKTGEKKILFDKVVHEKGITKSEVENAWIIQNSDLTVEDVRHSKNIETYRKEIQDILNKYPCTAYNNAFDFGFMEDRDFIIFTKLACPMKLATNVVKLPSKTNQKYGGYKWPKVQEAYDFFFPDNDYIEKHRGADDAFHEADIVFKLYEMGIFTTEEILF